MVAVNEKGRFFDRYPALNRALDAYGVGSIKKLHEKTGHIHFKEAAKLFGVSLSALRVWERQYVVKWARAEKSTPKSKVDGAQKHIFHGKKMTIRQICDMTGIPVQTVRDWVKHKKSLDEQYALYSGKKKRSQANLDDHDKGLIIELAKHGLSNREIAEKFECTMADVDQIFEEYCHA